MMEDKDIEKLARIIINIMPENPLIGLSILCTCIDHYGKKLGFSNEETWKMVNEVRVAVRNDLGEL